jgi:aminopeptidase YwaD
MKHLFVLLSFLVSLTYTSSNAQIYNDFYNDMVNNVSNVNLVDDITVFQNFGVKEPGTTANNNTKDWIVTRYSDLGYTDIVEQSFTVSGNLTNNVIITKTGLVYPNTYLIIDGHYDTVNGPGANDNGTGTVLIMELARILKDIDTEYSIKFIHFSGEEAGLIGSQFYVNNTVIPQNLDISLVFNIDEIGGINGMTNNTIVCERDESNSPSSNNAASAAATEILANSIELYSNLFTEISYAYGSDYVPFEDNGEIITGLYEKNESPYAHTPNDVIANMDLDYLFEITKGSLGASLHFAVGVEPISGISDSDAQNTIRLYPNPVDHTLYLQNVTEEETISIYSIMGRKVIECNISASNNAIDVSGLSKGIYFLKNANSYSAIKFIKE